MRYFIPTTAHTLKNPLLKQNATKRMWLYWLSGFTTLSAMAVNQTLPEEDSFARQRFNANAPENFVRWVFILVGTGFAGALTNQDAAFYALSKAVEYYLQLTHHTVFEENITEQGKRRVFFRGETKKEAARILEENRSPLPFSLISGEIGLPHVKDASLHPDENVPNGYTRSVISVTSDLEITQSFGLGEAVVVIVPSKQRIAPVSQHATKEQEGGEYEYITGGVHRDDVLGVAYRDPDSGEFSRFELNSRFTGNIRMLELDKQMEPLIALLPNNDTRKEQLLRCINPNIRYQDHYEQRLSDTAEDHRTGLHGRVSQVNMDLKPPVLRQLHAQRAKNLGLFKPTTEMSRDNHTTSRKPGLGN